MAYEASPVAGDILVTGTDAVSAAPAVFRVDQATGAQAIVSSGGAFTSPGGIAVEANGSIVVTDSGAVAGRGEVVRVDPVTGAQTTASSGGLFFRPFDIAVEADGNLLVVDAFASARGGVIRVDPGTGTQTMLSIGEIQASTTPFRGVGIALEADGSILVAEQCLAGGAGGGRLIRVDPASGSRTVVSTGGDFVSPIGVAVEADGRIVVADANAFGSADGLVHDGGVIRVDPETGTQTKVSAGGGFVGPRGIVVEADGSILVSDSEAFGGGGAVIRVDPVTGAHTTVASGGALRDPRQLAVVPTTGS